MWVVFLLGLIGFAIEMTIFATVPPATGFENYIIAAYPLAFWACFVFVTSTIILVFVGSAVSSSGAWKPAFGLLSANYGVFFYLPVHHGYKLSNRVSSDALAHLGFVKRAAGTGSFADLFYPLQHGILSALSFLGVPLDVAGYTLSFGITMIFILTVGLLLRELSGNDSAFPVGLAVATPLVFMQFQINIHPAILSFMFVPLVVFLIERARRADGPQFRLLYTFLALSLVLFHPMTTALLIVLLLSTAFFWKVYTRGEMSPTWPLDTRIAPLVGVVWFHWYSGFGRTRRSIEDIVRGIATDTETTVAADQVNKANEIDFPVIELVVRFIKKYGLDFLYLAVAGLFGLFVLYRLRRGSARFDTSYVSVQFFLGLAVAVIFLLVYLVAFDPIRVSRYAIVMAVVLAGLALHHAIERQGRRATAVAVAITCVILVGGALGTAVGTTYWPNKHMTYAEYEGSEFVLEHHDPDVPVRGQALHHKMQIFVTGNRSFDVSRPPVLRDHRGHGIPPGLGYPENDTAGESLGSSYLVTQASDIEYYRSAYYTEDQQEFLKVYDESHLRRLGRDPTANRIYTNGEYTLWRIEGE